MIHDSAEPFKQNVNETNAKTVLRWAGGLFLGVEKKQRSQ